MDHWPQIWTWWQPIHRAGVFSIRTGSVRSLHPWTKSFSNCSERKTVTSQSHVMVSLSESCAFISFHFFPPTHFSSARSLPPLLSSHLPCTRTFCYDQSDYIRALQWEAARKRKTGYREVQFAMLACFPVFTPLVLCGSLSLTLIHEHLIASFGSLKTKEGKFQCNTGWHSQMKVCSPLHYT